MKRCSRCQEPRPIDEFCRDRQAPDGLNRRCRACRAEMQRDYVARNRDKRRAYTAEWREANREKVNQYAREWRAENREAHLATKRRWRERNPDHSREYYEATREASFERVRRRRAIKYAATVGPIDLPALWTGSCGICGGDLDRFLAYPDPSSKSLDHIVPLAKGGTHEQANLQWVHLVCNKRKGAAVPVVDSATACRPPKGSDDLSPS